MAKTLKTDQQGESIILTFGGGLHSRASQDDIKDNECADGRNFSLDAGNKELRNRKPFDLAGTATNAGQINGFISLLKSDGSVSMLVQADDTVYEWDGASTFTSRGTVSSSARLRGRLEHNWQLDDEVLITDLALQEPVMKWNGTALTDVSFLQSDGSTAWVGDFRARYMIVQNERAIFFNIYDSTTAFPHLIVGAQRGDYTILSVSDRPSSSLNEADPFFMVQPDLRYINGVTEIKGNIITSSKEGSLFRIAGQSAQDFAIDPFFPRSGVDGDEALINIGNDALYARQGRIESLASTDKFGDVETDDLSLKVSDKIETYDDWTLAYNSRVQRAYCFSDGVGECWTLHKPMVGGELSPWMKWVTDHSLDFQPTAVMTALDPSDGLEYVFMGDASGNIYRMEGSGSGDGGTTDIVTEWLSKLVTIPRDAQVFNMEGWVRYRSNAAFTLTLTFEYQGENIFDRAINLTIPGATGVAYYGGTYYYGGDIYYTQKTEKLARKIFPVPGRGNEFQVRASVSGTSDISINQIGLRFEAVS